MSSIHITTTDNFHSAGSTDGRSESEFGGTQNVTIEQPERLLEADPDLVIGQCVSGLVGHDDRFDRLEKRVEELFALFHKREVESVVEGPVSPSYSARLSSNGGQSTVHLLLEINGDNGKLEAIKNYMEKYRSADADKVEEFDFVKQPKPVLEKMLIEFQSELGKKLTKSEDDKKILNKYSSPNSVPSYESVKGPQELLNWLHQLIYHKVKYYLPDHVIRPSIIAAFDRANIDALKVLAISATSGSLGDNTIPINYMPLIMLVKRFIPVISSDPLGRIKERLDQSEELNTTMLIIQSDVTNMMVKKELREDTGIIWVSIWRHLYKRVPLTMKAVVSKLSPDSKKVFKALKDADANKSDASLTKSNVSYVKLWREFSDALMEAGFEQTFKDSPAKKKSGTTKSEDGPRKYEAKSKMKMCNVCGDGHHFLVCEKRKALKESKNLRYHDNLYYVGDTPLPLAKDENLVAKYGEDLKVGARQR